MTKAAGQVLELATRLAPTDRAEVIDRLDELDDSDAGRNGARYDRAWAAELHERQAELERDPSAVTPWQEVVARLRNTVGCGE